MSMTADRIREIVEVAASRRPKVALDTCCVQYYISNPPVQPWADCLDPIFQAALNGRIELYLSTVVVSELLAHVHFASRRNGYDPEHDLLSILNRHFQILDVNGEVARTAGRLRGNRMTLKTPDALIGATSLTNGHTLFVTNDAQLSEALPSESCLYLRAAVVDLLKQRFPEPCVDADPIKPSCGQGWPRGLSLANSELGSVKPDPSVNWKCVLTDAFTVASALNEPCVFLILTNKDKSEMENVEILFWQETSEGNRQSKRIIKHLMEHLQIRYNREKEVYEANPKKSAFVFLFTSMERERVRQSQPCYASKREHQQEADAWEKYIFPLWGFRFVLRLPQTICLLCEDGEAHMLKPTETLEFLDHAKNVFGWEDGR